MNSRTVVRIAALASLLFWPFAPCHSSVAAASTQPKLLYTLGGGTPTWSIAFSPRGDLLATGGEDQTVKLWDLATGHRQRTLIGNAGTVGGVAFSPDGRTLATGSALGLVTLWDVESGQPHDWLRGVRWPLAFSPNGRLLATTVNNQVKLWDTRSWKVARTLPGGRPPGDGTASVWIGQIAFSPDGKNMATVETVTTGGGMSPPADFVQLWDTTTWKVRRSLHQPVGSQIQIAFTPDSRWLAVAGGWIYRGNVLLWNLANGTVRSLASLDDVDMVSSIVYDPHSRWVGFASQAGVRCVDVTSGKQFLVVKVGGHSFGNEQVLAIASDGRLLAAIREDGAVEIWCLPAHLEEASGAAAANAPQSHAGADP